MDQSQSTSNMQLLKTRSPGRPHKRWWVSHSG